MANKASGDLPSTQVCDIFGFIRRALVKALANGSSDGRHVCMGGLKICSR